MYWSIFRKPYRLGIDARLIPRPSFEESALRAAGLDGLDHLDAGDGGRVELALALDLDPGHVDAHPGHDAGHDQIHKRGGQAPPA